MFTMMVWDDGTTLVAFCDYHPDTQFTLQSDTGHRADVRGMLRLFEDHLVSQHVLNTNDNNKDPT